MVIDGAKFLIQKKEIIRDKIKYKFSHVAVIVLR